LANLGLDVTKFSKIGPRGTKLTKLGLNVAILQNVTSGNEFDKIDIGCDAADKNVACGVRVEIF
jgi:hypothetical protein